MENRDEHLYGAGEIADELGLTPRALRFYESKGLVSPRRVGSRRVYDHRDRARLKLVLRGKRLGFSLAEIREYLELYEADTSHVEQIRRLLGAVSRRIEDLEQQRQALDRTLDELARIRAEARHALAARPDPGAATGQGGPYLTTDRSGDDTR